MKIARIVLMTAIALALATDTTWGQRPERPDGPRRGRPGGDRQGPPRDGRGPGRGPRPPKHPLHVALDTNNDGEISANEISAAADALKKLDKNKDGKISLKEMRPQFGGRGGDRREGGRDANARSGGSLIDRIMSNDKNKDGKIDKDEMPERLKRILDRVDTNKDGVLDRTEIEEMAKRFRGGHNGRGRGRDGNRPEGEGQDRPRRPERPRRPGGDE